MCKIPFRPFQSLLLTLKLFLKLASGSCFNCFLCVFVMTFTIFDCVLAFQRKMLQVYLTDFSAQTWNQFPEEGNKV